MWGISPLALLLVTASLRPGVTALERGRAEAFLLNPQPLAAASMSKIENCFIELKCGLHTGQRLASSIG